MINYLTKIIKSDITSTSSLLSSSGKSTNQPEPGDVLWIHPTHSKRTGHWTSYASAVHIYV